MTYQTKQKEKMGRHVAAPHKVTQVMYTPTLTRTQTRTDMPAPALLFLLPHRRVATAHACPRLIRREEAPLYRAAGTSASSPALPCRVATDSPVLSAMGPDAHSTRTHVLHHSTACPPKQSTKQHPPPPQTDTRPPNELHAAQQPRRTRSVVPAQWNTGRNRHGGHARRGGWVRGCGVVEAAACPGLS